MRPFVRFLLFAGFFAAGTDVCQSQVIVRSPASVPATLQRGDMNLTRWSPGLQLAWAHLERIQSNEGAASSVRAELVVQLARQGCLAEAIAAAGRLQGLHRSLVDARLAALAAQAGESERGRALYEEAKKGLAFADMAGCQQIQAELAGAAAALQLPEEVASLLSITTDPEHLALALGNALAAGQGRPDSCPETAARLDELAAEDQKKFFVTRLYQARAVLMVATQWQRHPQGLSKEWIGLLGDRAVRLADNKLLYSGGHLLQAAELFHESGLDDQAKAALVKARDQIAAGGGFERGAADEIDLARLWRSIMGEDIAAASHQRALERLSALDPLLKAEGAALMGRSLWHLGELKRARQVWLDAAADLAGNSNADFVHEMLARLAMEASRCGADQDDHWQETVAALESQAGVAGKEEA